MVISVDISERDQGLNLQLHFNNIYFISLKINRVIAEVDLRGEGEGSESVMEEA